MQRLAKGWGGVLHLSLRDENGDLIDAAGTVTVTITDATGTIVGTGNGIKTPETVGLYTYNATPTQLANLGTYTITWTATVSGIARTITTHVDVVGWHLFGVDQLRARRPEFADTVKYPSEVLRARRDEVTEWLDMVMGVAVVTRRTRLTGNGNRTDSLFTRCPLIQTVISATIDGAAQDVSRISGRHDIGELTLPRGSTWNGLVDVIFEHGYQETPQPVREAALDLAVDATLPSALPARATVQNTDLGAFRLSIPAPGTPTGIPAVDMIIHEYGYRRPSV